MIVTVTDDPQRIHDICVASRRSPLTCWSQPTPHPSLVELTTMATDHHLLVYIDDIGTDAGCLVASGNEIVFSTAMPATWPEAAEALVGWVIDRYGECRSSIPVEPDNPLRQLVLDTPYEITEDPPGQIAWTKRAP